MLYEEQSRMKPLNLTTFAIQAISVEKKLVSWLICQVVTELL